MSSISPLRRRILLLTALGSGVVASSIHQQYREKRDPTLSKPFAHGLGLGQAYYYVGSILRYLVDAETSHNIGIKITSYSRTTRAILGLIDDNEDDNILSSNVMGLHFNNPVGISAGYDKHAEAIDGLCDIGFGFVEIGSVTPIEQQGNDKPRVFRLNEDKAIINRYGFNSVGIDIVADRLKNRIIYINNIKQYIQQYGNSDKWFLGSYKQYSNKSIDSIVGLNLGKSKTSPDASIDYVTGIERAGQYADYIVVNVSSPNTPGLRSLQGKIELHNLLTNVKRARDILDKQVAYNNDTSVVSSTKRHCRPLLVKIAPDLTEQDKQDICDVVVDVGIDGIIISNTTVQRPNTLQSQYKNETGGLSGKPLFDMSTQLVADMYKRLNGRIPIIGVGGIQNADDAYTKIKAGASLVQLYTAFAYNGPVLIRDIKTGLAQRLQQDGYNNIKQAVGVDANKYK